jgi:hypothetical protein
MTGMLVIRWKERSAPDSSDLIEALHALETRTGPDAPNTKKILPRLTVVQLAITEGGGQRVGCVQGEPIPASTGG